MSEKKIRPPMNWKEGRRLRAWELYEQGWRQSHIADALGVTDGAVSQWIKRAREGGKESLRHRPSPGRTPKLTADQRAAIPGLLARGAEAYGFRGDVWTAPRVAVVIEAEFGVRYDPDHITRLLKQIGWSPQQPVVRPTQRNEEAVQKWLTDRWPALKKRPGSKGVRSSG